jgi:hypothetical protein
MRRLRRVPVRPEPLERRDRIEVKIVVNIVIRGTVNPRRVAAIECA